jgi:GT2 family glycosyltransferase
MIPVLAVPVISRPDLLLEFATSIDHPVQRLVIIDNSPEGGIAADVEKPDCVAEMIVHRPLSNLGFSGSINVVIKGYPDLPWWAFANVDAYCGRGDLAQIERAMEEHPDVPFLAGIRDFRLFGQNAAMVEAVGFWDENYHPMYCEDSDYDTRIRLAGAEHLQLFGETGHFGSATITDPRYGDHNARTYPTNRAYYIAKWGDWLTREQFTTPFDRGGSVRDWTLDFARLRDNAWS